MTQTRLMRKSFIRAKWPMSCLELKSNTFKAFECTVCVVQTVHMCHRFLYRDFISDYLEDEEDEKDEDGGAETIVVPSAPKNFKRLPFLLT